MCVVQSTLRYGARRTMIAWARRCRAFAHPTLATLVGISWHGMMLVRYSRNIWASLWGLGRKFDPERLPELRGDFPNFYNFKCDQIVIGDVLLVAFECKASGIPTVGEIASNVANDILSWVGSAQPIETCAQFPALSNCSTEKFLFVVDLANGGFNWDISVRFVVDWMNDIPVPYAKELKIRKEYCKLIPAPPQYLHREIFEAMWVLECDESMSQGTAFACMGSAS